MSVYYENEQFLPLSKVILSPGSKTLELFPAMAEVRKQSKFMFSLKANRYHLRITELECSPTFYMIEIRE